jgi:hypothetical protein
MRQYVAISLAISSATTHPDSITAHLGLEPTSTRLRGTAIRPGIYRKREFDVNEWWLRQQLQLSPEDRVEELQESFFDAFLDKLTNCSERVKSLSESNHVRFVVVYQMGRIPYIGLSSNQVQKIAALGACIDFDVMI